MSKTYQSMDGNTAASHVSYAFTEVAAIYPITPSSTMSELVDAWSAQGRKNMFGSTVKVVEMQSEAGAAGAVHGAIQGGALATTYTASQGLLLMIPNIYKWVGELMPAVLHVSARSLATRSLSIFGDHQDIYACRQIGVPMLCSHSVQEVMDLAAIAHLTAIKSSVPFMHFFDGFRTSHEIQKIELMDLDFVKSLIDQEGLKRYRENALNPHINPITRGSAENDDIYFQGREAQNQHYANVVEVVAEYMEKISAQTGREYKPFTYYGAPDATKVIIAMGSVTETITEVIDDLTARGEKVGLVKVHLFRPFSTSYFTAVLPKTVKKVAVMDRTKEMGSTGEPLYLDIVASLRQANVEVDVIVGGRYGLSSKNTDPKQIKAVYANLDAANPINGFTVGIEDDVTHLSLKVEEDYDVTSDYTSCLFYGLGSDGTVSANKNSIKIIGDHTDLYSQAYFAYDSKKAGGATRSHLRFGHSPIRSTYYITSADFVSCSLDSYLVKYDMIKNLKKGGSFLLNTSYTLEEIEKRLPNRVKKALADKEAKFFIIDANAIATSIGMGRRTNTILQSAFFALNPQILPYEDAIKFMKEAAQKSYGKKGQDVVEMNWKAIDAGKANIVEVPVKAEWQSLTVNSSKALSGDVYFDQYVTPINELDGYDLPVSSFMDKLDGSLKQNVAFEEHRAIANEVPRWIKENCIQCNKCAMVCPHATIRPFLLNEEEIKNAPEDISNELLLAVGKDMDGLMFRIQVSPDNCVGCSLCVVECPGKGGKKALEMVPVHEELQHAPLANYLYKKVTYKTDKYPLTTPKGAAFMYPYFEVSGACAGCGETPYYRLVTQLFGKDMMIANATGCSSIYTGSAPSTPLATDSNNQGPAWANSLFEDNAEFGFGMKLASQYKAKRILEIMHATKDSVEAPLKALFEAYEVAAVNDDREAQRALNNDLLNAIEASSNEQAKELLSYRGDFVAKSQWIIGGDGWAYDIGYGGLDHVMASGENVNILILDTEVYSNTGGQSSKSTPTAAIAKFAAGGKPVAKKDIAQMAIAYGHVYVAHVAMGANMVQLIKALKEAEAYDGPSLIIAYSPCIEHGIKGGLANHQESQRKAVESGYITLFRYNPTLEAEGKNPLTIDSKEPDFTQFRPFLMGETRFSQLIKINPDHAEQLFVKTEEDAKRRYNRLTRLAA